MKKNLVLAAVLGSLVLAGCSKSETIGTEFGQKAISFENYMHKATRASEITTSNVSSSTFTIQAYHVGSTAEGFYTNQTLSFTSTAWNTASTYYWPYDCVTEGDNTASKSLSFFAYNDGNYDKGTYPTAKPTLTYTVAGSASSQKDVLAAYAEGRIWKTSDENSKVPLDFKHILSEICFTVIGSDTEFKYEITKLTIGDNGSGAGQLYPTGTYTYGQAAGVLSNLSGDKAIYSYTGSPVITLDAGTTSAQELTTDVLMLVPQDATSAKITVTYKVKDSNDNVLFDGTKTTGNLAETWANGKKYTYALTLPSGAHAIQYNVSVTGWETGSTGDLTLQ